MAWSNLLTDRFNIQEEKKKENEEKKAVSDGSFYGDYLAKKEQQSKVGKRKVFTPSTIAEKSSGKTANKTEAPVYKKVEPVTSRKNPFTGSIVNAENTIGTSIKFIPSTVMNGNGPVKNSLFSYTPKSEDPVISTASAEKGASQQLGESLEKMYDEYRDIFNQWREHKLSAYDYQDKIDKLMENNKAVIEQYKKETGGKLDVVALCNLKVKAKEVAEENRRNNIFYKDVQNYYDSYYADDFEEYVNKENKDNEVEKVFRSFTFERDKGNYIGHNYYYNPETGEKKEVYNSKEARNHASPSPFSYGGISRSGDYIIVDENDSGSFDEVEELKYLYMTDEERQIYKYQLNKYGKDKADDFLDHIEYILNQRRMEGMSKNQQKFANEHPILGTVSYVGNGLFTPMSALDSGLQGLEQTFASDEDYRPYDPYTPATAPVHAKNASREGITQDMPGWGKFLTETGLSIGENIVRLPLGQAGLITMAAGVAGETAVEKGVNGETNANKAFMTGAAYGAVEYLTEKLPFENLMKVLKNPSQEISFIKSFVENIAAQAGIEASEEAVSNIADNIVDNIINGDKSDYNKYKKQLIENGYSANDAEAEAFFNFYVYNTVESAFGGALSGGFTGGGSTAIGYAVHNYNETVNTGHEFKDMGDDVVQSVVDTGNESDKNTSAYKYAQKMQEKQNKGKDLSDWNVGRQYQKNVNAITSEEDFIKSLSNIVPTEVHSELYDENGIELNGQFVNQIDDTGRSNKRVDVSANGDTSIPATGKHEFTHLLKVITPQAYQEYSDYVLSAARETNSEAVENRIKTLQENYNYSLEDAEEEVVAELTGKFNTKAITNIANGNVTLADKISKALRTAKAEFQTAVSQENYTNDKGVQLTYAQLNKAEQLWNNALRQAAENKGNASGEDVTRNSIIQKDNGDYKIIADRDIFKDVAPEDRNTVLKNFINENLRGNQYTALTDGEALNVAQKNKTVQKLYRPGIPMNSGKYSARQNTVAHYDEVLEASKKTGIQEAKNDKHNQTDIDKRNVEIEIPQYDENGNLVGSSVWETEISVLNDTKTAYDISKLRDITKNTHSDLRNLQKANPNIDRVSLSNIVSQQENFVKSNPYKGANNSENKPIVKNSFKESDTKHKNKQFEIIQKSNPADDDYHTWIRSADEIKTLSETLSDGDWVSYDSFAPDYTREMAEKAIKTGKITIYSSYPIEQGVFVTPSKMEAESYSGKGQIYKKDVHISDVAWIDPTQGQYAKVESNIGAFKESTGDTIEKRLSGDDLLNAYDTIEEIRNVGGRVDENGYAYVYHNTSKDNADNIRKTGVMSAKEDGIFVSTKSDGQATGYGNETVALKIPVENLVLDDVFDDELHFRIPLNSKNDILDVSNYLLDNNNSDIRYSLKENQHTPEQLRIIKEYENAVDEDLLDFIEHARTNPNDNKSIFVLSDVTDRMAKDVKSLTGIDVEDFGNVIKNNSITHIEKDHGENGTTDHSMADGKDIARIQYVIDNYDDIKLLDDVSGEYRDKNQKPAPLIKISKRIDGTYYVVEAVPDTRRHQLAVVSAYKNKAVEQQMGTAQSHDPNVRNDSPDTASTDIIFNQKENVKYSFKESTGTADNESQERLRALMNERGVSSPSELSPDTVTREQSKKDRNVFRGKSTIQNLMSSAYTAVVDDMHPFWNYNKTAEKALDRVHFGKDNPYKLAINAKDAASRAAYIVSDKMVDFDNNEIGNGLVETITESGIKSENYNDFNNYLVARHALEWLDSENHGSYKNVYDDPALNDMGFVQAMVDDFESKNPEFKQAAQNLYEWQRQLMKVWLVDTGVITEAQYNKFTEMYPDYVPFFREDNVSMNKNEAGGFANQGNIFKQAVGSQQKRILQPIESIMYNVASYVNHATKHEVTSSAVRLYDMLENDSENNVLRQYWEEVFPVNPDDNKPQYFKTKDSNSADIQDVTQEAENSISQTLKEQMNVKDGVITLIDNGKKRYFRVYDKGFLNVLDNAKSGKFDGVLGMMASISRVRAALITSWNPAFSLASNPIRDFGTLILNSSDKNKAKIAKEAAKAYIDVAKGSKAYKQYLSMGGQYSSVTTDGMDAMKLAMQKLQAKDPNLVKRFFKLFPKAFNVYQTVSDAIESSPRMAEFKATLNEGHDFHEAFYRAKDVTTNFSRGGKISKELNAVSNFFNASIQGVDKYFRQAKNNPKSFAVGIACLTAVELLSWAWNSAGDDEDKEEAYENLSNYTKNNFYNFYIGDGKFVTIPKARESAVISSAIGAALNATVNEQEDRFKGFFSDYILSQFLPDGSIAGLSTWQDLRANKDYMDRPIVSSALEDLPDELQYDDSTSYLAKWLGGILHQSPKRIDHIINSETGVFGKINKTYFSPSGQQDKAAMFTFGVNSTFNKDSLFSTDQVNFFYTNKENANKQANGYPSAENNYLNNRFTQAGTLLSVLNSIYKEDSESEAGREIRKAYVNYAKDNKDNPRGLSDEVYNNIKYLFDTDDKVLALPAINREIKAKIDKEDRSFVFNDAESILNYQEDLNKGVDEAYRKLLSDVNYYAMSNVEKADALKKAKNEAVKAVKEFYIVNEGKKRMYDDSSADIVYPGESEVAQYKEKQEYQAQVTSKIQTVSDNLAAAVPDKADDYSVADLQINDVKSVTLDGKSYDISGDVKDKIIEAANEKHYSNIEKLMNNEINVEDVVGYTAKGKAKTTTQADGKKVQLTGKLYNDDGSPRFDELATARIIYQSKEAAKKAAIEQYKDEITGTASQPTATDEPIKVSSNNQFRARSTSSGTSSRKSNGGISRKSGGGSSSKSSGGRATFTARANTGGKVTFVPATVSGGAGSGGIIAPVLPNTFSPNSVQTAMQYMSNKKIKPQPLAKDLMMM